jgi:hypothetical protein
MKDFPFDLRLLETGDLTPFGLVDEPRVADAPADHLL